MFGAFKLYDHKMNFQLCFEKITQAWPMKMLRPVSDLGFSKLNDNMAIFGRRGRLPRFTLLIAGTGVIALCLWSYSSLRYRVIGTLIECHKTGGYGLGEILVRSKSPDSNILLIGLISDSDNDNIRLANAPMVPSSIIYQWDPVSRRLSESGLNEWRNATGDITYRYLMRDFSTAPIKRTTATDLLSIDESPIITAAPYAIDMDVSPDRQFVNVISANAPRNKGQFMRGGGYPKGPYYHEVFERKTGKKIGDTFTLKDPQPVILSFCWEAEGKYVVYHDGRGRFLWIVPGPIYSNFDLARNMGPDRVNEPAPESTTSRNGP